MNQRIAKTVFLLTSDLRSDDSVFVSLRNDRTLPSALRISDRRTISAVATDIEPVNLCGLKIRVGSLLSCNTITVELFRSL